MFSQEHEDAIRAERAVEATLRTADLAAEMEMHYQPIIDTGSGEIALVEGLARWTSPTLGRIPPDRFIAAAERCGMIHTVTLMLLRKALADCARLPPAIGLSFNLSAHDLASPETMVAILAAVTESGLNPRRLTMELTETALMRDFERAKSAITALRTLGIKIALDDFGTGYSSLGYVHRLPLDKIKIDRSFMADIDTDLGCSLVSTILDLCQNLGLDGIAEGIETATSSGGAAPRLPLRPGLPRRQADAGRGPASPPGGRDGDGAPQRLTDRNRRTRGAACPDAGDRAHASVSARIRDPGRGDARAGTGSPRRARRRRPATAG